jgi:hypothetical protein
MGFAARGNATPTPSRPVTSQFAIADFDGDNRPDFATVQPAQSSSVETRYWIGFQLSSGERETLGVTAPTGGLQITSRDVNGDKFIDVIVTTAWTNKPVAVLLNDGHGGFTRCDSSAFPSAIQSSESRWSFTTLEIKDAAAALLSSYVSGYCKESCGIVSPRGVVGLLLPWAPQNSCFSAIAASLGRAPPSFVPHV